MTDLQLKPAPTDLHATAHQDIGPITGTVMVVDDQKAIRSTLCTYLEIKEIEVIEAESAEDALEHLDNPNLFLIFTDIMMPGIGGLDLLSRAKEIRDDISVVLVTGHTELPTAERALADGAFFFLMKPFFMETAMLITQRAWEVRQLRGAYQKLQTSVTKEQVFGTMSALAAAMDAKNTYTHDHSERVACLSRRIARKMDFSEDDIENIFTGALLHDVGKVGIPDDILDKNSSLTREQIEIIQTHPETGERILAPIPAMKPILPLVRSHHENWDGTGYPDGLKGEEIPPFARIVKITDTYDAVTSARPYRQRIFTEEETLDLLEKGRGTQYDPATLDVFLEMLREKDPCLSSSDRNA